MTANEKLQSILRTVLLALTALAGASGVQSTRLVTHLSPDVAIEGEPAALETIEMAREQLQRVRGALAILANDTSTHALEYYENVDRAIARLDYARTHGRIDEGGVQRLAQDLDSAFAKLEDDVSNFATWSALATLRGLPFPRRIPARFVRESTIEPKPMTWTDADDDLWLS